MTRQGFGGKAAPARLLNHDHRAESAASECWQVGRIMSRSIESVKGTLQSESDMSNELPAGLRQELKERPGSSWRRYETGANGHGEDIARLQPCQRLADARRTMELN